MSHLQRKIHFDAFHIEIRGRKKNFQLFANKSQQNVWIEKFRKQMSSGDKKGEFKKNGEFH